MERALELLRQGDLVALERHLAQQAKCARRKAKEDAEWCRTEYWKDVEDIARGAYESNDEGEYICDAINGNGWLTSDQGVYAVMEHTDHEDEGAGIASGTWNDVLSAFAEAAMDADVRKCLEDNRADWDRENEDEEDEDAQGD